MESGKKSSSMHPAIKKFSTSGEVTDSVLPRQRDLLDHIMLEQMREAGYIPVLGLGPFFSTKYDVERDLLIFDVSYYGVRVGKKSWDIEGIDLAGKFLRRTPPSKLELS